MGFLGKKCNVFAFLFRYLQSKKEQMKIESTELIPHKKASLFTSGLEEWREDSNVIDYGAIIICRSGNAKIGVNFNVYNLYSDAVITLFPNDVITLHDVTADFKVEILEYDAMLLREASLQLEKTVYKSLREDRCRTDKTIVSNIVNHIFGLLNIYFVQKDCTCINQLVLLQLKAFFLGFYDYLYRHPSERIEPKESPRTHELFNLFMMYLEQHYKESRDVKYFADLINITPKYLNTIVNRITHNTTKTTIDNYVILQLKLQLRTSQQSIKEIAWEYHFSDESFFCRYFKTHTGITPQQLRMKTLASN